MQHNDCVFLASSEDNEGIFVAIILFEDRLHATLETLFFPIAFLTYDTWTWM